MRVLLVDRLLLDGGHLQLPPVTPPAGAPGDGPSIDSVTVFVFDSSGQLVGVELRSALSGGGSCYGTLGTGCHTRSIDPCAQDAGSD